MKKIRPEIRFLQFALTISFFFIITTGLNSANIYKQLTAVQCDSLVKANALNPNFVILDVRTPGEYLPDHLKGAINRNSGDSDIDTKLNLLPKAKLYLLHCQSGGRSAGVFSKMKGMAFAEVYEMIGGMNSWKIAGKETTTAFEARLMMVKAEETTKGAIAGKKDTFQITVTNRANDTLRFTSITLKNQAECSSDFNKNKKLAGAEDYLFTVYYTPAAVVADSVKFTVESNGGQLAVSIPVKKGSLQNVDQNNLSDIVMYPNPAKDFVWLKSGSEAGFENIRLIDLTGRTVNEMMIISTNQLIDISFLGTGSYILQVSGKNRQISRKLIISR